MEEHENERNEPRVRGAELLLAEPEIVAWLTPVRDEDDDDYEPPRAA